MRYIYRQGTRDNCKDKWKNRESKSPTSTFKSLEMNFSMGKKWKEGKNSWNSSISACCLALVMPHES